MRDASLRLRLRLRLGLLLTSLQSQLQVQRVQATFQLKSLSAASLLQLDSIKASAGSCVSFEADEKLSPPSTQSFRSPLKAEPSTDCSAGCRCRCCCWCWGSLSVAQWRHVSLGQGIKIKPPLLPYHAMACHAPRSCV